ncbi:MAG TPA: hypothetical protein PLU87_19265 [Sedimentisphaerales bacterium]|nr:hypothetical protein [Sedimentisphaerales bacterium]HRS13240.1 hypothetical protein [Sedimentisphaerales bacterium]HRV49826.1 hypothetical protein [Sedimentisphaerales bacterium]
MIPIYEQGAGHGIDHCLQSFLVRFEQICQEHLHEERARAFAFVFYDFRDEELRRILRDQGVFAELDRLSGTNLSLFYLHAGRRRTVERFNGEFLDRLGLDRDVRLPCVVFFRVKEDKIEDVIVAQLENANLIHGFRELYGVIERYINENLSHADAQPRYLRLARSGARFIGIEFFRAFLRSVLDSVV